MAWNFKFKLIAHGVDARPNGSKVADILNGRYYLQYPVGFFVVVIPRE